MKKADAKGWTYEKAGVPHLKGDETYNRKIVSLIRSTHVKGVMGSALGFASLFDLKKCGLKDPLLVASTDGVGTKLELARLCSRHDTIGIDLVAMCVNDLICCGAKPLFFLDYYATGKFQPSVVGEVLQGVTDGCRQAGCALVGGETAVMPGFYGDKAPGQAAQYDMAGFSVGAVDRKKVISGGGDSPRGHCTRDSVFGVPFERIFAPAKNLFRQGIKRFDRERTSDAHFYLCQADTESNQTGCGQGDREYYGWRFL